MTDRSVPFTMGPGTCLRFDRGDIEALETAFSTISGRRVGYPDFPEFLGSLTGRSLFVWRGLKVENPEGKLVHVFPLNVAGSEEAGEMVWKHLQQDTGPTPLITAITEALFATRLFKRQAPAGEKKTEDGAAPPKNSGT